MNKTLFYALAIVICPLSRADVIAPNSQGVNLGRVTSGDISSLSADDDNVETVCKFVVPNNNSPIVMLTLGYQSPISTPTYVRLQIKAAMARAGGFSIRASQHDFANNSDVVVIPDTVIATQWQTYLGVATGVPADYLSPTGIAQSLLEIHQVGPSSGSTPCVQLGYATLKVVRAGLADSPWPKQGHDSMNTSLGAGPTGPGKLRWSFPTGNWVQSVPVFGSDGTLYVGSVDGYLYALDAQTGSTKWSSYIYQYGPASALVGIDDTLYFGAGNVNSGAFYAYAGATGTKKWSISLPSSVFGSPAMGADGSVFFATTNGSVYAVDAQTGAIEWTRTGFFSMTSSSPAIGADGTVYVTASGSVTGGLYALDSANGNIKWHSPHGWNQSAPTIGLDGTLYVGGGDGICAIEPTNGSLKWKLTTKDPIYATAALGPNGYLYVGTWPPSGQGGKFYAIRAQDGQVQWTADTGYGSYASPVLSADGTVYYVSSQNNNQTLLTAADAMTGIKKWGMYFTGNSPWTPSLGADGTYYVGSSDSNVYAVR